MLQRIVRHWSFGAAAALVLTLLGINLWYASPFVRAWDEVDFVLAVERFDLLAMQPHFPGYPYFIAGAKLFHAWVTDPAKAMIAWNAVLACSSAIPIALLARRVVGLSSAGWAAAAVLSAPYLWLMGSRPMSECAGIAVLWWYLWSVKSAAERPRSSVRLAISILLFSVLMGIRLSYFPFGLALLLLLAFQYRTDADKQMRFRRLTLAIAGAVGAQLIWISGLVWSEGTLQGFWTLSMAFVAGHFSEWGGGVASANVPIGTRFVVLVADHLIRDVWLSRSGALGALYALLLALTGYGIWRLGSSKRKAFVVLEQSKWLLVCLAVYAAWVLLGQNIEKPRHIAPVAGPLLLVLYATAMKTAQLLKYPPERSSDRTWNQAAATAIQVAIAALITVQTAVGAQMLKLQAEQRPAVYQMNDYLKAMEQPLVLYTWEESRVLGYLRAGYEHRKIYTYDYFLALANAGTGRRVFVTNHVRSGFMEQAAGSGSSFVPVARFDSESLFDPVYSRITLYEWKKPEQELSN
ncbi:hypothetical protein RB620_27840 [Paenibacillus sp. LHD-117]|uniref:hypothetical protein n=1 Tax=Paenibacillus sp. LHD-117 TaxID=3071412 RepID=UPI0027E193F8|nr:hypothetical protein [Paenibacillus sp. LHD-117]MDQ6423246.1 hypothetical protein [Paenibacillus sp. LHD-117]